MENNDKIPGKGAATASMVLGIISVVLWFFGYSALVSVILGIVGLILAGNAKKAGFVGGLTTATYGLGSVILPLIIAKIVNPDTVLNTFKVLCIVFDWPDRRCNLLRSMHCLRGRYRRSRHLRCL